MNRMINDKKNMINFSKDLKYLLDYSSLHAIVLLCPLDFTWGILVIAIKIMALLGLTGDFCLPM